MTDQTKLIIQKMLRKARKKLSVAQSMFEQCEYDDSTSRAYYAVFHAITAVLLTKNLTYSSHAQTIGAFNKEFVHLGNFPSDFTQIIQRMFSDRQMGDYGLDAEIDEEDAEENLKDAEAIINECENYLKNIEL